MKLLIVDDEPEILKKLTILAESHGHVVKTATSIESLRQVMKTKAFYPHVIILDRMLSGVDSLSVIPDMKLAYAESRLLIVSAVDTATEKALALDAGADDYVAKPFSGVELMARVHALARRKSLYTDSGVLKLGNLTLNREERSIRVDEQSGFTLSQKEFQLLYMFCSSPGKIFPREVLLEQIWQSSSEVESKVVEATINNVRRKLESYSSTVTIKNMRNVGYWLET
ncbi:MAG: response regulator transcription factor [Bdellovibrio sp.]